MGYMTLNLGIYVDLMVGSKKHHEYHNARHGDDIDLVQPHGSMIQPILSTLDDEDESAEIIGYLYSIMVRHMHSSRRPPATCHT
jgi:hypothetical protein